MDEPIIMSDINLLAAIHKYYLFPHFSWAQKGDEEAGGTPSFLARHMFIRYFLMVSDLESAMESKWKLIEKFDEFKATLDGLTNEEKKCKSQK